MFAKLLAVFSSSQVAEEAEDSQGNPVADRMNAARTRRLQHHARRMAIIKGAEFDQLRAMRKTAGDHAMPEGKPAWALTTTPLPLHTRKQLILKIDTIESTLEAASAVPDIPLPTRPPPSAPRPVTPVIKGVETNEYLPSDDRLYEIACALANGGRAAAEPMLRQTLSRSSDPALVNLTWLCLLDLLRASGDAKAFDATVVEYSLATGRPAPLFMDSIDQHAGASAPSPGWTCPPTLNDQAALALAARAKLRGRVAADWSRLQNIDFDAMPILLKALESACVRGNLQMLEAGALLSLLQQEALRKFSGAYHPDEVVRLHGAYGYAMAVEFANDETVMSVSLGDTTGWQVVQRRNVVFLKPQDDKAETNLLIHTSRRSYSFALMAFRASGPNDPRLTYRVRFRYPDDEQREQQAREIENGLILAREVRGLVGAESAAARDGTGMPKSRGGKGPSAWNFNYTFKGDKGAAPLQMLDDGEFTYIKFANYENLPAIFHVDSQNQESLVNYRREGEWLVVERLSARFTFRANNNTDVACIYNDAYPERAASSLKEKKL